MTDFMWTALCIATSFVVLPIFVYICAKMWAMGTLRGQQRFYEELKEQSDGDEESKG